MKRLISLFLVLAIALTLCACGGSSSTAAVKLSDGYKSKITEYTYYDNDFIFAQNKLGLQLFSEVNKQNTDKNVLISPVSAVNVLGMLLAGANDTTAAELTALLSCESEALNHNLYTFFDSIPNSSKIVNTNSVWIKDDNAFKVNNSFLQTNADFYSADIFKLPFDAKAMDPVNNWVKRATDGEIDTIADNIDKDTCMYLINALTFDAEWHTPYATEDISDGTFNAPSGSVTAKMMRGSENYFIRTDNTTGFIKEYTNGDYRFVALLPNEETDINEYISSLKSDSIANIVKGATEQKVTSVMPKFNTEFEITLNEALKSLGVKAAFDEDKADFTGVGTYSGANLYLADVLQKTYITVDEKGTKAGAVSKAEIAAKTALEEHPVTLTLDRPFVYAIVEAKTNIPLFIGKVIEP